MFKPAAILATAFAVVTPAVAIAQAKPPAGFTVASVPASAWNPLFNGKDFTGWTAHWAKPPVDDRPASALFTIEEGGVIHAYAADVAGTRQQQAFLQTDGDYRDYRISLEYKWGTKKFPPRMDLVRDAGLVYHNYENPTLNWPHGIEAQIQEGDTGDLWGVSGGATSTIDPLTLRYTPGGVPVSVGTYGSFDRIRHGALNELPGEWNTLEVIVKGDTAVHIVNGFVNLRATDLKKWDANSKQWVRLDHGKISIQAEFAEIYYRNIRIRPLTPEEMK